MVYFVDLLFGQLVNFFWLLDHVAKLSILPNDRFTGYIHYYFGFISSYFDYFLVLLGCFSSYYVLTDKYTHFFFIMSKGERYLGEDEGID